MKVHTSTQNRAPGHQLQNYIKVELNSHSQTSLPMSDSPSTSQISPSDMNRSTFPYCIVQFVEDGGSVSVAPTSWLVEEGEDVHTFWPSKNVKRNVTFKSDPEDGWKMFAVKVVHYSKSYSTALESLRFFKLYSDIELCSEDESDSNMGPLPKLQNTTSVPEAINLEEAVPSPSLESGYVTIPEVTHCNSCQENKEMFGKMMDKLNCIMEEVKELKRQQSLILPQHCDVEMFHNYPVSSVEGIKSLEDALIDKDLYVKLTKYLGQFGGKDVSECTRRVLSLLMTNELSTKFNWVGGHEKVGLRNYPKVVQLIADAVRQSNKDIKQAVVEEIIKRWLRTALDRDGGRNKRKISSVQK